MKASRQVVFAEVEMGLLQNPERRWEPIQLRSPELLWRKSWWASPTFQKRNGVETEAMLGLCEVWSRSHVAQVATCWESGGGANILLPAWYVAHPRCRKHPGAFALRHLLLGCWSRSCATYGCTYVWLFGRQPFRWFSYATDQLFDRQLSVSPGIIFLAENCSRKMRQKGQIKGTVFFAALMWVGLEVCDKKTQRNCEFEASGGRIAWRPDLGFSVFVEFKITFNFLHLGGLERNWISIHFLFLGYSKVLLPGHSFDLKCISRSTDMQNGHPHASRAPMFLANHDILLYCNTVYHVYQCLPQIFAYQVKAWLKCRSSSIQCTRWQRLLRDIGAWYHDISTVDSWPWQRLPLQQRPLRQLLLTVLC